VNIPAPWSISAWVSFIGVTVQVRLRLDLRFVFKSLRTGPRRPRAEMARQMKKMVPGAVPFEHQMKVCLPLDCYIYNIIYIYIIYTLRRYNYILITILVTILITILITILLNIILLITIIILVLYLYMMPWYDYIYIYALDCTFMKMIIDDVVDPTLKNA
jgi:hypothetical protein